MTVKQFCRNDEMIDLTTRIVLKDISTNKRIIYDGIFNELPLNIEGLNVCKVFYFDDVVMFYVNEDDKLDVDEEFNDKLVYLINTVYSGKINRIEIMLNGYKIIMRDGVDYFIDRDYFINGFVKLIEGV